jgi:predicted small lipoprotein YifL
MRKALLLPVAALALTSLAACGQKAKNEAAEANEAMAGDSNTMGEAVSDVNAAQAAAFSDAENAYSAPGNASEPAGNEITD